MGGVERRNRRRAEHESAHPACDRSFERELVDRFQLAGLALICLKNETKVAAEQDLRTLIAAAGADMAEKERRERLLHHLEATEKPQPLELAKYSLERAGAVGSDMDIKR